MKFTVSSTTLCNRLQVISRVQASKSALPILDCILFVLSPEGLILVASDSETTVQTQLDVVDPVGEGKVAIDAKRLISSVKEISEQPITFDINDETYQMEISYQNGHYEFVAQDGNDFPVVMAMEKESSRTVTMPCERLLNGISRTLFATADDELRPIMNGVYVDISDQCTAFVATDGHKMVRNRVYSIKAEENTSFIMPKKPAILLKNILPHEEGDCEINYTVNSAEVVMGKYFVSCRLTEGRYPNYNSVIPQNNPFHVRIDRMGLLSALRRTLVFASASTSLVKLSVDGNTMTVSAQDIDFSTAAQEKILCEYDGVPMSIGFSGHLLVEVLNTLSGQDVILELADPSRAGVLTPAEPGEDEDLLVLLMPMMLQD